MAPQSGSSPSYTAATEGDDRARRLADMHRRLSVAMDNANAFGAFVDPRALVELRDVVGDVLELIGDPPGCPYGCGNTGFHCPISEPLERIAAQLQASCWIAFWDPVDARGAHDTVCLCGSQMSYLALRPADASLAQAWAVCGLCRHWKSL